MCLGLIGNQHEQKIINTSFSNGLKSLYIQNILCLFPLFCFTSNYKNEFDRGFQKHYLLAKPKFISPAGLEPATYRLEVCRAAFAPRRILVPPLLF